MALLWAAGIIWMAVDFASPDNSTNGADANSTDAAATPISTDDVAELVDVLRPRRELHFEDGSRHCS